MSYVWVVTHIDTRVVSCYSTLSYAQQHICSTILDTIARHVDECKNRQNPRPDDFKYAQDVQELIIAGEYQKAITEWGADDEYDIEEVNFTNWKPVFKYIDFHNTSIAVTAPTQTVNDHTCIACGNTACSKTETSCWKCGTVIS